MARLQVRMGPGTRDHTIFVQPPPLDFAAIPDREMRRRAANNHRAKAVVCRFRDGVFDTTDAYSIVRLCDDGIATTDPAEYQAARTKVLAGRASEAAG
jgi:hypothetical protein